MLKHRRGSADGLAKSVTLEWIEIRGAIRVAGF
jgi:hypothetical protein